MIEPVSDTCVLIRMPDSSARDLAHRAVEIDLDNMLRQLVLVDIRQKVFRPAPTSSCSRKNAVPCDPALWPGGLPEHDTPSPIGSDAPAPPPPPPPPPLAPGRRMTRTSWQKILAAEIGAPTPHLLRQLVDFGFHSRDRGGKGPPRWGAPLVRAFGRKLVEKYFA